MISGDAGAGPRREFPGGARVFDPRRRPTGRRVAAKVRAIRGLVPRRRGRIKRARAPHFVYLLRCGDCTYYVGYTTDPARRLAAHRAGHGARYTRGRGPLRLMALWRCPTIAAAYRLELRLKRLPRKIKHRLAAGRGMPDSLAAAFRRAVAARVRRTR
jgi:putative endonuclease